MCYKKLKWASKEIEKNDFSWWLLVEMLIVINYQNLKFVFARTDIRAVYKTRTMLRDDDHWLLEIVYPCARTHKLHELWINLLIVIFSRKIVDFNWLLFKPSFKLFVRMFDLLLIFIAVMPRILGGHLKSSGTLGRRQKQNRRKQTGWNLRGICSCRPWTTYCCAGSTLT